MTVPRAPERSLQGRTMIMPRVDPDTVQDALALAHANFEIACLRRRLRAERWISIAAVIAASLLALHR